MADRLTAARAYLANKPTDRFALYALAMELRGPDTWDECFATFDRLLTHHPSYAVGHYHYATALERAGRRADAQAVVARGVIAARAANDGKTLNELLQLQDSLDSEE